MTATHSFESTLTQDELSKILGDEKWVEKAQKAENLRAEHIQDIEQNSLFSKKVSKTYKPLALKATEVMEYFIACTNDTEINRHAYLHALLYFPIDESEYKEASIKIFPRIRENEILFDFIASYYCTLEAADKIKAHQKIKAAGEAVMMLALAFLVADFILKVKSESPRGCIITKAENAIKDFDIQEGSPLFPAVQKVQEIINLKTPTTQNIMEILKR